VWVLDSYYDDGDEVLTNETVEALLSKVNFNPQHDHLILTGDLIAKGPDSRGAVDLAMKMGASCVRGNWEDRTLLAYNSLVAKVHPLPGPQEDPATREDFLDEESFSHGDYKDRALAKLLSKEQVKWLKECPVILRVGSINGGSEIVVVHAGLVPGVDLDRQDPFQVMNMRTIDLATRVPSEDRDGEPWEKVCFLSQWKFEMKRTLTCEPVVESLSKPRQGCGEENRNLWTRFEAWNEHPEME